jgi:hypothetical protein
MKNGQHPSTVVTKEAGRSHQSSQCPSTASLFESKPRATGNHLEASCLLVKEAAALVQLLQQAHPTNRPSKSSVPNKMYEEEKDLNYPKQE